MQSKHFKGENPNPSLSAKMCIKTHQKPANQMIAGFFVLRKQAKYSKIRSIKWSKSRVKTLNSKDST